MKKSLIVWLCSVICCSLVACAAAGSGDSEELRHPDQAIDPLKGVVLTDVYDGLWSAEDGLALSLDSQGRSYVLRTKEGRQGSGYFAAAEENPVLYFDSDCYRIVGDATSFVLQIDGTVTGESLDGIAFGRDDRAEIPVISPSVLDGIWNNPEGITVTVSVETLQFEVVGGVAGTLGDDGDGKGLYFQRGNEKWYCSVSEDKSSFTVLQGGEIGLSGSFLRSLEFGGTNDPETLAQNTHYYDTWYQYSSKIRGYVTLTPQGTWEAYDKDHVLAGKGTFYVSADGSLLLYETSRKLAGIATLDENDCLTLSGALAQEDGTPYFRSSVSY